MLPQPLALGAHLDPVAVGPEAPEDLGPRRAPRPVESRQIGIGGHRRQVGAVARDRDRVLQRRSLVVRSLGFGVSGREPGAGELEQAHGAASSGREVALEGDARPNRAPGGALDPAPREEHVGRRARHRGGAAKRRHGGGQQRGVAELERQRRQRHGRRRERPDRPRGRADAGWRRAPASAIRPDSPAPACPPVPTPRAAPRRGRGRTRRTATRAAASAAPRSALTASRASGVAPSSASRRLTSPRRIRAEAALGMAASRLAHRALAVAKRDGVRDRSERIPEGRQREPLGGCLAREWSGLEREEEPGQGAGQPRAGGASRATPPSPPAAGRTRPVG